MMRAGGKRIGFMVHAQPAMALALPRRCSRRSPSRSSNMPAVEGNLLAELPRSMQAELFQELVAVPGVRIERIVSTGQASPPGHWYDEADAEWVVVLTGSAGILF